MATTGSRAFSALQFDRQRKGNILRQTGVLTQGGEPQATQALDDGIHEDFRRRCAGGDPDAAGGPSGVSGIGLGGGGLGAAGGGARSGAATSEPGWSPVARSSGANWHPGRR